MRHEWKEPIYIPGHGDDEQFRTWGADSEVGVTLDGFPVDPQAVDTWPEEILRLAEENRALKLARQTLERRVFELDTAYAALDRDCRALKERLAKVSGFDRIAADRLADEVAALAANRHLDSRSAAADALLDYRNPPRTERSDRIAALEAEVERYVEESGRHAKAFRLQLDRAVAAEAERDRALGEVERLRGER